MKKVLIIEDSSSLGFFQVGMIQQKLHYPTHLIKSKKDLDNILQSESEDFFIAILNMILPDAKNGEALDTLLSYNIPVIVHSSVDESEIRSKMATYDIVDYVSKIEIDNFEYILRLVEFVHKYGKSKILIVDDSSTARMQISHALKGVGFEIFEAASGDEALVVLEKEDDIVLVTMDKEMPGMNGYDTIKNIRRGYDLSSLSVLGVSSSNDKLESINFIKNGANDFIYKPFLAEELLLRVMSNIELISAIHSANERAIRDFMTKLYNRKYVFEDGLIEYKSSLKEGKNIILCMIDIDKFKLINDTYGHPVGDRAIILLADILTEVQAKGAQYSARIGGEEFLMMWIGSTMQEVHKMMEQLREKLSNNYILSEAGEEIRFTVSIGMAEVYRNDFEQSLSTVDKALYQAKESGRDCITVYKE